MIIQHNMLAMNNLMVGKQLQKGKLKNMEQLASGYRINRAADDAANMAISEKMTSRIRALARCQQNIEEGISLAQTADGALNEVNNMLNRVNELCVQAANGTNTAEDRSKIAAEITQIYDDMDRIFETTEFNTMKIFRHDGDNYYGPEAEYLYHESVTETPGELHNWGAAMFPTKQFDLAKPATAATATLTLADGVDLNDATTLDGTSFFLKQGSYTFKIAFGQDSNPPSDYYNIYINTKNKFSVKDAFNSIQNAYQFSSFLDTVSVNGKQVSFTFKTPEETKAIDYSDDIDNDGNRENITAYEVIQNGAKYNGISIYSGNTLESITASVSNDITYAETATQVITILPNKGDNDPLADDLDTFRKNAENNTLSVYPNVEIKYSDFIYSISTAGEFRNKIVEEINKHTPPYSAVFVDGGPKIAVTITGLKEDNYTSAYISENTKTIETINALDPTNPLIDNTFSVNIQTIPATSESFSKHTFQIPEFEKDKIYTIRVNDQNYVIYDYNTYKGFNKSSSPYYYDYNSSSRTMSETFIYILKQEYETKSGYSITVSGNDISFISKQLGNNSSLIIENSMPSSFVWNKSSENISGLSYKYYNQEYFVPIDFSSHVQNGVVSTSSLNGKGFLFNNKYYQFRNASNTYDKYNSETKWIELSGETASLNDLATAIKNAINSSKISVVEDSPTSIKIVGQGETSSSYSSSYINFINGGPTGTFSGSVISSGGAAQKNPQAEIDFSKYDMDNLDDLYGTGFRLTCATCPGEFVNVMFCHDKSELNYPESFEYTDENGNTNTIHNYMVELKDVTDGSQIAAYIAEQLERDLDHFTEVKVSDTNPAVLIAQDKRSKDQNGRGQVLAGVYTNFLYNVDAEKLPNLGDKVGGGRKDTDAYYAYCMIYAGDTKEKPYIAVHLPHFSVENLKLEYPGEPWDTYEKITDVMNRSKNAAEVVSMARSKIGADQNRLEHSFDYAANAEEQITDAMSRIKDTDMAEAVTTQAKLTILSNTQEAMLSQIADLPERILPLLQQ